MRENELLKVTFKLALEIIAFCEKLESQNKYVISKQLLRSGTSIGANAREAQSAESRADFIHKLKISAKEAEEVEYWLDLYKHSESYPDPPNELFELRLSTAKLLSAIISRTRKNRK